MKKNPELLSPVHDYETLKAAIKGGADSIYFGAGRFHMRQHNLNFKESDIPRVIEICHNNKIKAYLALNVILYDEEIEEAIEILKYAKNEEIDAVIVHNPAMIKLANEFGLEVHISTMANATNSIDVNYYYKLGARRIVLARELTLTQIKEIKKKSDMEIEVFIHGAMCVSFSGHCLMSYFNDGQSACRGQCVQPCRRRYKLIDDKNNVLIMEGDILSTKDLCTIDILPQLLEAEIDAFKIEGRRRNPEYVQFVTEIYREAIKSCVEGKYSENQVSEWKKKLNMVYNRGYSHGFYLGNPSKDSMVKGKTLDLSTHVRFKVGIVEAYNKSNSVATILVDRGEIKLGDQIIIVGSNTYLNFKVSILQSQGQGVDYISAGKRALVYVPKKVFPNDKIFIFVEKNRIKHYLKEVSSELRGLFITFEGIDGCGKTTQAKLLFNKLQQEGQDVCLTKEPGSTNIGEKIRNLFLDPNNNMSSKTELFLIAASQSEHIRRVIEPAIAEGKIVICDRFKDSTIAYQGYGREFNLETIKIIQDIISTNINPDITFLLDIEPVVALERMKARENGKSLNRIESEEIDFYQKVREGFINIAHHNPLRIIKIDATLSIDDIHSQVFRVSNILLEQKVAWYKLNEQIAI